MYTIIMIKLVLYYLVCIGLVSVAATCFAEKPPLLALSIDSDMIIQPYTNRSIGAFSLQGYDVFSYLYWVTDQKLSLFYRPAGITFRAFLTGLLQYNYHLGLLLGLGYHELGHGTRASAFGYDVSYSTEVSERHYFSESYYELLKDLFNYSSTVTGAYTHYGKGPAVHPSISLADSNLIISAGGVNNEMYLAKLIEDRFYSRGITSVYDFFHYLYPKLGVYHYASYEKKDPQFQGDLFNVQSFYKSKYNFILSYDDFKRFNGYAILLSSSFWAFIDGWSRYVVKGFDYIHSYEAFNFRLPDVNLFLTSHGPSYHVQSGYRFSNRLLLPFAIEYVFLGDKQLEYTFGLERSWMNRFKTYSELRLGYAVGLSQSLEYAISSRCRIALGVAFHHFNNLYGERHIKTLANGPYDSDSWFNLQYRL